ncbi:putative toxin-antitoxin system toxin component, PIN family [Dyella psychrodurans]|uniref:Putative toxin-antitoxin system toxin component, PIN family n=1 Tax=Dyella psychrodurans TaxID=1927960 RepID=A0A370X287_9GAMM|nr:putative toxin-antitoxin system toxin component, PIN family [Dyella psychrodurans]RDS82513.1 putative toxin-antitoxin system toxin component, PIN family [Dyella psychrodurans]
MSPGLPRYVLDTNVCLDAFVFDDPQCASLLMAARIGEIELVTRDDCRAEWLAVLTYPQLKLSQERRAQAVQAFDTCVRCLCPSDMTVHGDAVLPRCSDRDDQKFLELAHQSGAVALLTRDDALLRLARRTKREGLFAILPPALWREVESGLG